MTSNNPSFTSLHSRTVPSKWSKDNYYHRIQTTSNRSISSSEAIASIMEDKIKRRRNKVQRGIKHIVRLWKEVEGMSLDARFITQRCQFHRYRNRSRSFINLMESSKRHWLQSIKKCLNFSTRQNCSYPSCWWIYEQVTDHFLGRRGRGTRRKEGRREGGKKVPVQLSGGKRCWKYVVW